MIDRPHDTGRARDTGRQRGFSLVELMVSLVLASLVILGVIGVYSSSRETFVTQDDLGRMQESMRIGNGIVERTLRQGSFRQIPLQRDQNPLLLAAFGFVPVTGIEGAGTTIGQSDTVEIVYNGSTDPATATADGGIVDCLGASVAGNVQSRNRFQVRVDAGRPWLACSTDGGATWTNLVPDVEAMEVQYGIYSSENRSVTNYVTWSNVADPLRVVALRVHLLYRSATEVGVAQSPRTYQLGEQLYGPFPDRFLRSASEATIVIRSVAL
ncbi:MAG: PilW family protein [Lautropia sp.]